MQVKFLGQSPHAYQPENHTIDDHAYWTLDRHAGFQSAVNALDPVRDSLWGTGLDSSYSGINDRVPTAAATAFGYSLALVDVYDLRLEVSAEGANFGNNKRKVREFFTYSQKSYGLSITDPVIETQYLAGPDGEFEIGRTLLCVSLGEPYQGHAYKIIAGVILPP
jgi:hypothetical protein